MTSSSPHILLIDDDPLFRGMVASLLSAQYRVEVASDGSEGFYHALENPPQIAVIDIRMPGWDGLTTLKAFRSHPQLSHVKIVMLTSDATRTTVLDAIGAGADDYVIKTSFTKQSFTEILENLLKQSTQHAPSSTLESNDQQTDHLPKETLPVEKETAIQSSDFEAPIVPDSTDDGFGPLQSEEDPYLQEIIDAWE